NLGDLQDALGPGITIEGGVVTLDLMDIFLDCTGRHMQGWTSSQSGSGPMPSPGTDWDNVAPVGYLTHASASMAYEPDEQPCLTGVNNAYINGATPYLNGPDFWHIAATEYYNDGQGNTSETTVIGWNMYYDCMVSTEATVPSSTIDVNDPDEMMDFLEGYIDQ